QVVGGARKEPPTGADRGSRARIETTARRAQPRPTPPRWSATPRRAPVSDPTVLRAQLVLESLEIPRRAPHGGVGADGVPAGQPVIGGTRLAVVGRAGCVERGGWWRRRVTVAARDEVEHLELEESVVEGAGGVAGLTSQAAGEPRRQEPEPVGDRLGPRVVGFRR